jgi:hypothetical protein
MVVPTDYASIQACVEEELEERRAKQRQQQRSLMEEEQGSGRGSATDRQAGDARAKEDAKPQAANQPAGDGPSAGGELLVIILIWVKNSGMSVAESVSLFQNTVAHLIVILCMCTAVPGAEATQRSERGLGMHDARTSSAIRDP